MRIVIAISTMVVRPIYSFLSKVCRLKMCIIVDYYRSHVSSPYFLVVFGRHTDYAKLCQWIHKLHWKLPESRSQIKGASCNTLFGSKCFRKESVPCNDPNDAARPHSPRLRGTDILTNGHLPLLTADIAMQVDVHRAESSKFVTPCIHNMVIKKIYWRCYMRYVCKQ
jgi:hypothetical protein